MAITRVQNQISFTQKPQVEKNNNVAMERLLLPMKHYRNCDDIPDTVNMIRPEAGQGRLLSNNPIASFGRFFANRYYDLKAVYKGYTGTANDHQLGRTNDVGLLLGGLGIASFLTTKRMAALPKHMEFVGLASFLTSMSLWPTIGVFGPARLVHGFEVDKRYIDDQGRNKSVFQDPNYVPFDLYRKERKSEDLSAIADYMGISKDVKNREEMTKDQMRKIAIQNHTLWMWSSGFAVPTMTALLCNGFERLYQPHLEKSQAAQAKLGLDSLYSNLIKAGAMPEGLDAKQTDKMSKMMTKLSQEIGEYNVVEKEISKFVKFPEKAESKIITSAQLHDFITNVTKDAGHGVSTALAKDISSLLSSGDKIVADDKFISQFAKNIEQKFSAHPMLKHGIVSYEEISKYIKDVLKTDVVDRKTLIDGVLNLGNQKIANSVTGDKVERVQQLFANNLRNDAKILPKSDKLVLTVEKANILRELSAPLQAYIAKFKSIREVNALQLGNIPDSQDSYYWNKLEKTFADIIYKETPFGKMKGLMNNEKAIEPIIKARFEAIAADSELFAKTLESINKIKVSYLTNMLGEGNESKFVDLILGENPKGGVNWNQRTFAENGTQVDKFIEMQSKIAKDFKASLESGALKGKFGMLIEKVYGKDFRTSVAASEVTANVGKIENFVTACDKILHSLDVYRRAYIYKTKGSEEVLGGHTININKDWVEELFEKAKTDTVAAKSSDIYSRFNSTGKPRKFQSYMNLVYAPIPGLKPAPQDVHGKGYITEITEKTLGEASASTLQHWINKFRNLVGHDPQNWYYSDYSASTSNLYNDLHKTPEARYRVQGKNILEFAEQGAKRLHNSGRWLRSFGGLFVGVWSASILAQFFFGKKDDTIPLKKHGDHYHVKNPKQSPRKVV